MKLDWDTLWEALFWKDSVPSEEQQDVIDAFRNGARRIMVTGGERAGKSMVTAFLAGTRMGPPDITNEESWKSAPPKLFWLVAPTYLPARVEFKYIRDALHAGGFIIQESMQENSNQPWSLTTAWNVRIETKTSYDETKLASFSIHGAIMCEAGAQDYNVLNKLYGRVSETRGFVILSGTLENNYPWYEKLYAKWQAPNPDEGVSFSIPSWANRAIYPEGRNDKEIKLLEASTPTDWFQRRYAGIPVKPEGLVIPEFDFALHVKSLERVEDVPVQLAIDPGKNAYAVLFVQHIGAITYVLDAVYTRGLIVQDVLPLVMGNPLWRYVDKTPAANIIDIAGTQAPGSKSQVDIWREATGLILGSRHWHLKDTIAAVRFRARKDPVMGMPLLFFSDKMKTGYAPDGTALEFLSEFELWRWPKYNLNSTERAVPIDNNNHGIKALGYKLLAVYGIEKEQRKQVAGSVRKQGWRKAERTGRIATSDGLTTVTNGRIYRARNWLRRTSSGY